MTAPRSTRISLAGARRIALAAQGFGTPRPATPPGAARIAKLVGQLGLLQLDSVNVFCRSHYMPVFSRLGPYDTAVLDRIAGHTAGRIDRRLVEYWAHEASLLPLELWPLMRWRMMDMGQSWGSLRRVLEERPELVAETLALVATDGPIRQRDTGIERAAPQPGQMWNWHEGKMALEHLFYSGQIGAARRVNFERHYDLIERVLPPELLARPGPERADAQRELMRVSARALGIATEPDLGDYFRLPRADSKARVAELVESGELLSVEVEGWEVPAYLWSGARQPRRLECRALLTPFDPVVWFRQRAERLFDFHYRIEIYTPAPKRVYGYYVLPFLLGETIVGRVDLKSDRQAGALLVHGAFAEPGVDLPLVAAELAAELTITARWLGLGAVRVGGRGDLALPLSRALASAAQ